jgi:hypothetical protein
LLRKKKKKKGKKQLSRQFREEKAITDNKKGKLQLFVLGWIMMEEHNL